MIDNLDIYNFKEDEQEDDREIISDLKNSEQKKINSKHFYDEKGSKLFDKISELKEYYPTRTELEIIEKQKYSFKTNLPSNASVIEFGSGSNKKTDFFSVFAEGSLPERHFLVLEKGKISVRCLPKAACQSATP